MTVSIKNLRLQTILGVNPVERTTVRDIIVNLRLDYDATAAAASDNLADAIDYKEIRNRVIAIVRASDCRLIEALAARIVDELKCEPRVQKLDLEIDKPGALRL